MAVRKAKTNFYMYNYIYTLCYVIYCYIIVYLIDFHGHYRSDLRFS